MSLFQCSKCGVIENTALTQGYLARYGWPEQLEKRGLPKDGIYCSLCFGGEWHGRFPREVHPVGTRYTDKHGNITTNLRESR